MLRLARASPINTKYILPFTSPILTNGLRSKTTCLTRWFRISTLISDVYKVKASRHARAQEDPDGPGARPGQTLLAHDEATGKIPVRLCASVSTERREDGDDAVEDTQVRGSVLN